MASRGMSVVYSIGDEAARKQLLDGLLGVLQGNSSLIRSHLRTMKTNYVLAVLRITALGFLKFLLINAS